MKFLIVEPSPLPIHFFGPNIRLRILFSNIFRLHSSPNVRDHVSQLIIIIIIIMIIIIIIIIIIPRSYSTLKALPRNCWQLSPVHRYRLSGQFKGDLWSVSGISQLLLAFMTKITATN